MSYVVLHADRLRTVATNDPLIPVAQVPQVRDAAALLAEAGRLRDAAERDIAAALEAATIDGFARGQDQGRAAAATDTTETLARLESAAVQRERERRGDVARLAIEVVRRIAGDLGDATMVAGLAERAVASLAADGGAVVRVAPAALGEVRERLAGLDGIRVEDDDTLAALDCVLETPLGRTHAGLETQLSAIERAWTGR